MPGDFRRPPVLAHGMAYAVTTDGGVMALSLYKEAQAQQLAKVSPGVAFNRYALADVPSWNGRRAGWCLIGAHSQGVEITVLATGEVRSVHAPRNNAGLAVNPVGEAAGFRGVACDEGLVAFAEYTGTGQLALGVRRLNEEKAAEYSLFLNGSQALGPVLNGSALVLCAEEEVGVVDLGSGRAFQLALPRAFRPLLVRRPGGLSVPSGSIPLSAALTNAGPVAFIGGTEGQVSGVLRMEMESGRTRFDPLGSRACLTSNSRSSLCTAGEDEVRIYGQEGEGARAQFPLHNGMPAIAGPAFAIVFGEQRQPGTHHLRVFSPERPDGLELYFEDNACRENTCCTPLVSAAGVTVPYFSQDPASKVALRLAHWDLSS